MTELYEAARRYVGALWDHRGRSSEKLDCAGLAVVAARDVGWLVHDMSDYRRHPSGGQLEAQIEMNMGPPVMVRGASLDNLQPNDVVTLRYGKHGRIRHVGVIGAHSEGGLSIIHADGLETRRVVEHRLEPQTVSLIANVYRRTV